MADAVPPPIRRRPGGRSARVRAAVLEAVLDELAEHGYAGLTSEAVAARAGVHRTTVYRRWGTREHLVLDAMLAAGPRRVPIPDTGALASDLLAYGMEILENLATPEVEATVRAVAATSDHDRSVAELSRSFWTQRLEAAAEIVDRAVDRGEVPADVDPRVVIEAFRAPLYFLRLMTGDSPDVELVAALAELVANGAAATPTTPRPRRAGAPSDRARTPAATRDRSGSASTPG